jgi:hypothetical protein
MAIHPWLQSLQVTSEKVLKAGTPRGELPLNKWIPLCFNYSVGGHPALKGGKER